MSKIEMEGIVKILKSLEECSLLIKDVTEIVENGAKEQKRANLVILFSSLGASLSENKRVGNGVILAGEDTTRTKLDY